MSRPVRTVGVEEELLVIDPESREAVPGSPALRRALAGDPEDDEQPAGSVTAELFRHQVETTSAPTTSLDELDQQLRETRRTVGTAAARAGLAVAASGVVPTESPPLEVSDDNRYRDMVQTYGDVARGGGTCAMHVHVGIESDDEGVAVIDRLAPWLPVLVAISANSPLARGHDTGYASWRTQMWSRWPSAGPTEPFGDAAGYRRVCDALVESGAARDRAMLYFDARLAEDYPTVEVRVCDVLTDVEDAVLVTALIRALVTTVAEDADAGRDAPHWRVEMLRAARWRASRWGLAGRLLHPVSGEQVSAHDVVRDLVAHVRPALEDAGDAALVDKGVERVLLGGGAARQRATLEATGSFEAVVDDLVARTEAGWREA